ncbi:holo-ACP synthase [Aspergillus ruber CBS 135680]|uniref:Phosphopantetheinyl transferase PptB n=1 Tax=Aspergillus ruber (strain CBS 135680) TaxID=1388766 RepID=A0A017S3K5_ASPRC|nr:phosphopantetheinyl transferase PptB [Aspergillus ruber CBS 135680]EYE91426.1 phosphopantetheinyl transferase PptB [Aspergillus ruber CBS 135680]
MKPHPFPLSLNIGTDIVHLPRIARLVSRPNGYLTRFTRRILSDQEQADFRKRFNLPPGEDVPLESRFAGPTSSLSTEMARWLAGRFAAKEAARKAAPGGAASVGWKDVIMRRERGSGRPGIVYLDANGGPGRMGKLSISHDGEYVVATVLAAG